MRESQTAIIERNVVWSGTFTAEPYEAAWASEAIYFVRALDTENIPTNVTARVQISPDGMHWCDEGSTLTLPATAGVTFCRISHFGGWLRLVGELPAGARMTVIVYLVLKA